jgi:hypothetical protein
MDAHCPRLDTRDRFLDEAMRAVLSSVDMQVVVERAGHLLR